MRTSRGRKIVLILAVVFAIILETITANRGIKYNVYTVIPSTFLYFAAFVFIIIDAYYSIKSKKLYHIFSLAKELLMLLIFVLSFYCFANTQKLIINIIIIICIIVLIFLAFIFSKKANKYYPYTWD